MSARRRSRQHPLRNILLLTLGAFLLGGSAYLVWFSPVFQVQEVEVIGQELVPDKDLSGGVGENILFWEFGFSLEELPQAGSVSIDKQYLGRKIIITLDARGRYAIWCLERGGGCYWVDDTGKAFTTAPDLRGPLVFRLVRDNSERRVELGGRVLEQELFENLKLAFRFLEELDIPAKEFRIENLKFKEATAITSSGPDIQFSLLVDPSFGAGVVRSLRDSGEWEIISYLDLRVENRAYYSQ